MNHSSTSESVAKPATAPAEVLVIEDEAEIRELISLLLLRQGHRVRQCGSAIDAIGEMKKTNYDLMILDWMLPQMSGLDFLKSFEGQTDNRPPVLMVTAKAEPVDIVAGLEAGADDYITKPFEPAVFAARVRALLRRAQAKKEGQTNSEVLEFGGIRINTSTYEVFMGKDPLHLTPSEFKILTEMGQNQGRVLTREYLISVVQGDGITVTGRTIDTHVFGLRKKMGSYADVIETIRGVGYRVRSE